MSARRGGIALDFSRSKGLGSTLVAVAVLIGGYWVVPAEGRAVEGMTLREGSTVEKEYGAIAGSNPSSAPRDPATCESSLYCDTLGLSILVPSSYSAEDRYSIIVALSWPNSAVNNVDLYLYDRNKTQQLQYSASTNPTESVGVYDPPAGTYYVVVLNFSGVNSGYKVKAQFVGESSGRPSSIQRSPPPSFSFGPPPAVPMTEPVGTGKEAPKSVAPRAVASPGPDAPEGATKELTLTALGSPKGFEGKSYASAFFAFWVATAVAAIAGGLVWFRRRRALLYREEGA